MKEATKEKSCELLSDEQIIDLYFAREERAIKETDHKYGKYLFTIAYNIVQDTLDCEECLNDTYLNTWNRIPPTRPSIFHAFLSKIMRNIAVDRYRHNKAQKRAPSEMLLTLEELAIAELSRLLNDYLKGLSDRERLLFVCRYYYADKISEIAKMLQAGERSVYRELAALREGLRQRLEKEGFCCE